MAHTEDEDVESPRPPTAVPAPSSGAGCRSGSKLKRRRSQDWRSLSHGSTVGWLATAGQPNCNYNGVGYTRPSWAVASEGGPGHGRPRKRSSDEALSRLVDNLWAGAQAEVMSFLHHPFFGAVLTHNVPSKLLTQYLNDESFLFSAATTLSHQKEASSALLKALNSENSLRVAAYDVHSGAAEAMCFFLQQKAASDNESEALVAWLAMLRVRALLETVIGQRVPTSGIGKSPFVEWIRSYGSETFQRCISSLEDALESLHPQTHSQVEMDRLLDIFRTTVRLDMEVLSCMYSNVPKYSQYRMEQDSPWNPCNLLFATDYDCTCTIQDTCELLIWAAEATSHITDGRTIEAYHRIGAEHDVNVQDCLADLPDLTFDSSQKFTSEVEFELLPGMDPALGPVAAAILDMDLYYGDRLDLKPVAGHPAIREALLELADLETETIEVYTSAAVKGAFLAAILNALKLGEAADSFLSKERRVYTLFVVQKLIAAGLLAGLRRKNIKFTGKKAVMQEHSLEVLRRLTKSGTCIHVISANWSRDLIHGGLSCLPGEISTLKFLGRLVIVFSARSDISCYMIQFAEEMLYVHSNELEYNESEISTGKFQEAVTNAFDKEHILEILRRIANQYIGADKPGSQFVPDDEGKMVVYIGDAQNDMLALLDADLGIIIGDNSVLRHLLLRYSIQVWPLVEASAHLFVSRLYGSHRSYRQSGILFQAGGWEDVEACLFGQCTLHSSDEFWTYWRPHGQQGGCAAKMHDNPSQLETPPAAYVSESGYDASQPGPVDPRLSSDQGRLDVFPGQGRSRQGGQTQSVSPSTARRAMVQQDQGSQVKTVSSAQDISMTGQKDNEQEHHTNPVAQLVSEQMHFDGRPMLIPANSCKKDCVQQDQGGNAPPMKTPLLAQLTPSAQGRLDVLPGQGRSRQGGETRSVSPSTARRAMVQQDQGSQVNTVSSAQHIPMTGQKDNEQERRTNPVTQRVPEQMHFDGRPMLIPANSCEKYCVQQDLGGNEPPMKTPLLAQLTPSAQGRLDVLPGQGRSRQGGETRSVSPSTARRAMMQQDQGSQGKTVSSAQQIPMTGLEDNEQERHTNPVARRVPEQMQFDGRPMLIPANSCEKECVQQDQGRNAPPMKTPLLAQLTPSAGQYEREDEDQGKHLPHSPQRKHIDGQDELGVGSLGRKAASSKKDLLQQEDGDGACTNLKTASSAQCMPPHHGSEDEYRRMVLKTVPLAQKTAPPDNEDRASVKPIGKPVGGKCDPAQKNQEEMRIIGSSDRCIPMDWQIDDKMPKVVRETVSLQHKRLPIVGQSNYEEQDKWKLVSGNNDLERHVQLKPVSSRTGQTPNEDEMVLITVSVTQRKPHKDAENVPDDQGNGRLMYKPVPFEHEAKWAQTPQVAEDQQDLGAGKSHKLLSTPEDINQLPAVGQEFSVNDELVTNQKLGDSPPYAEKLPFTLGPQATPAGRTLSFSRAKPLNPMPKNMWMASEGPGSTIVQQHSLDQLLAASQGLPKLHEHRVPKPRQSALPHHEPALLRGSRPEFDQQETMSSPADIAFGSGRLDSAMDGTPSSSGFNRLPQGRAVTPPRMPPVSHGPTEDGFPPLSHGRPISPLKNAPLQTGIPGMAVHTSVSSSQRVPAGEDIFESPLRGRVPRPEIQHFVHISGGIEVRDNSCAPPPQRGTFGPPQKPDFHTVISMQQSSSSWNHGPSGMDAGRFRSPLQARPTSPPRMSQGSAARDMTRDKGFAHSFPPNPAPPRGLPGTSMGSWLNQGQERTQDQFESPLRAQSLTPPQASQEPLGMDTRDTSFSQGPDKPQTSGPEKPSSPRVLPRNQKTCGSLNQGLPRICACGFGSPQGGPISPPKLPPFPQDHQGMDMRKECSFTHGPGIKGDGGFEPSLSGRASSPSKITELQRKDTQKPGSSFIQGSAGMQGSPSLMQQFSTIPLGVDTRKGPHTSSQARSISPTKMPQFLHASSSMNLMKADNKSLPRMGGSGHGLPLKGRAITPPKVPQFHQFSVMDMNRQASFPKGHDTGFQPPLQGGAINPAITGPQGLDAHRRGSPLRQPLGGFTAQVQGKANPETSFSQVPHRPPSPIKGLGPMGMSMATNVPNPFSFKPATSSMGTSHATPGVDARFAHR